MTNNVESPKVTGQIESSNHPILPPIIAGQRTVLAEEGETWKTPFTETRNGEQVTVIRPEDIARHLYS